MWSGVSLSHTELEPESKNNGGKYSYTDKSLASLTSFETVNLHGSLKYIQVQTKKILTGGHERRISHCWLFSRAVYFTNGLSFSIFLILVKFYTSRMESLPVNFIIP